MRPLKYKNLGNGVMIRVPQIVTEVLPQLLDIMQQLEENGEDSCEVILEVLSNIDDRLSNGKGGRGKGAYSMSTDQTKMTESKFLFVGIFTDKNYSTVLAYMATTAQEAWDKCTNLNPTFLVQNWGLADHMVGNCSLTKLLKGTPQCVITFKRVKWNPSLSIFGTPTILKTSTIIIPLRTMIVAKQRKMGGLKVYGMVADLRP